MRATRALAIVASVVLIAARADAAEPSCGDPIPISDIHGSFTQPSNVGGACTMSTFANVSLDRDGTSLVFAAAYDSGKGCVAELERVSGDRVTPIAALPGDVDGSPAPASDGSYWLIAGGRYVVVGADGTVRSHDASVPGSRAESVGSDAAGRVFAVEGRQQNERLVHRIVDVTTGSQGPVASEGFIDGNAFERAADGNAEFVVYGESRYRAHFSPSTGAVADQIESGDSIVPGADGSSWDGATLGVVHTLANGKTIRYAPVVPVPCHVFSDLPLKVDLVERDGTAWFSYGGFEYRVDPSGHVARIALPGGFTLGMMLPGPANSVWFVGTAGGHPSVARLMLKR